MPQLQGLCTLEPMRHKRDPMQQKEKEEEEEMFTIWSKLEREKKKVREKEIFTIREMNIWM